MSPNELLSPYWRMGNAMISYVVYLGQMLLSGRLGDSRILVPAPDLSPWTVLAAFRDSGGHHSGGMWPRDGGVRICWSVGCGILTMLLPVIGLIQFGIQAMADRFTYLPQIGLCIALAWGAAQTIASWPYRREVYGVGSALVLAVLIACAWRQTTFWRESEILWTRTVACTSQRPGPQQPCPRLKRAGPD